MHNDRPAPNAVSASTMVRMRWLSSVCQTGTGVSCITWEVAESLGRKWACSELVQQYLDGALGRFKYPANERAPVKADEGYYKIPRPSLLWNGPDPIPLAEDGGRKRPASMSSAVQKKVRGTATGEGSAKFPVASRGRGE